MNFGTKEVAKDANQCSISTAPSGQLPLIMPPTPSLGQAPVPVAIMIGQNSIPCLPDGDVAESIMTQNTLARMRQDEQSVAFDASAIFTNGLLQDLPDVSTQPQPVIDTPSSPLEELTEEEVHMIEALSVPPMKIDPDFPIPTQHQPPASSLVSPPASTHTDNESNTPTRSRRDSSTISSAPTSRLSSRQPKAAQRYTPESGPARRSSTSSMGGRIHERESESPSVVGSAVKKARRGSRLSSEIIADEESLRLIRELQAEDRGLRRRG